MNFNHRRIAQQGSNEVSRMLEQEKAEREKKLRALELKIRMRRFYKLNEELNRVKNYLLNDIAVMEETEDKLSDELKQIKDELLNHK
jgi:hypothetical protein